MAGHPQNCTPDVPLPRDQAAAGPIETPRVISPELALAHQFLATLTDLRAPWLDKWVAWAAEQQLSPELTRSVRVAVLRLRVYGAAERTMRRRRP